MSSRPQIPRKIGNWILDDCLGSGYSGSIWRATNPYTGQIAALKLQDVDHECPTNRYERYFYPCLQGGTGMPTLLACGVEGNYDYLVIDLLGPSLDNLYRKNGCIMDLRSTLCIAMQVISRLELMHHRGILHRDIQLGNCVVGLPPKDKLIYMIDFGFSKMYIDPRTRSHIPNSRAKRDFIGNYWFSSVNVHCRGKVPSRRDDLEALALMLIHMLTPGGLPWTRNGIPRDDDAHDRLIEEKRLTRPEALCRDLPSVFEEFLRYCRRLKFFDQPDYEFWRVAFADAAKCHGFVENDGEVNDELQWPPRSCVAPSFMLKQKARHNKENKDELEKVLAELANLNLVAKKEPPKPNNPGHISQDADRSQRPIKAEHAPTDVIVISSDESSTTTSTSLRRSERTGGANRLLDRQSKAAAIKRLTLQARAAVTNNELASVIYEFTELLRANRSKVVTKDGFEFLTTLARQLENPSVFVVCPDQGARQPEKTSTETREKRNARNIRGVTVKVLYQRLSCGQAKLGNPQLANYVSQFCDAVRATSGKNLSKDGFAFLAEMESRLRQS